MSVNTPLFIDGVPRLTSASREIRDPASPDTVVGNIAMASREDVQTAIYGASQSFKTWSARSLSERATVLKTALDQAVSDGDFLQDCESILTQETGKILHESRVDFAVFIARWRLALDEDGQAQLYEQLPCEQGSVVSTKVTLAPLGPVTIIVPYNWPVAILGASLPNALVAGNSVIVKVPLTAPLATTKFVSRIAENLPAGVLSVVVGPDDEIESLITDRRIAKVCFTGSVATGAKIMSLTASKIGRLTLELGGNDAAIICEDAVLDDVHLDRIFHAIFDTTGQICMNIKRLFVHVSRFDELVSELEDRLRTVVLGHGLDATTTHGPVHSQQLAQRLEGMIAEAENSGAEVRRYGVIPDATESNAPGHFVRPALVLNPDAQSRIVTEEQFGPIIPILQFDSEEEVIFAANDTWAGLGGSVWSRDEDRAVALGEKVVAGYIWINDHGAPRLDLRAPFGGWRQSGFGREQGLAGLREFMDTRTIAISGSVSSEYES